MKRYLLAPEGDLYFSAETADEQEILDEVVGILSNLPEMFTTDGMDTTTDPELVITPTGNRINNCSERRFK